MKFENIFVHSQRLAGNYFVTSIDFKVNYDEGYLNGTLRIVGKNKIDKKTAKGIVLSKLNQN